MVRKFVGDVPTNGQLEKPKWRYWHSILGAHGLSVRTAIASLLRWLMAAQAGLLPTPPTQGQSPERALLKPGWETGVSSPALLCRRLQPHRNAWMLGAIDERRLCRCFGHRPIMMAANVEVPTNGPFRPIFGLELSEITSLLNETDESVEASRIEGFGP